MRSTLTATQIIRSTVSDDFEKDGAPFVGLRSRLRFYLNRAQGHKAVAQDEFPLASPMKYTSPLAALPKTAGRKVAQIRYELAALELRKPCLMGRLRTAILRVNL